MYLAMGQTKKALPDLTSSIYLKPDFLQVYMTCCYPMVEMCVLAIQARVERASTLLKIGKLDDAVADYTELVG